MPHILINPDRLSQEYREREHTLCCVGLGTTVRRTPVPRYTAWLAPVGGWGVCPPPVAVTCPHRPWNSHGPRRCSNRSHARMRGLQATQLSDEQEQAQQP